MEPKVSVIIPRYNMATYICDALSSILSQSFQDYEVLVVDDASTDDTRALVMQVGDSRIRLVGQRSRRGPSAARNAGIRQARGEYIAFLDADDIWLPTKLELQSDLLSKQLSVGIVYCGAHEVDNSLRYLRTPDLGPAWPLAGHDAFIRLLEQKHSVVAPLSTMMLRKVCFDAVVLFDEQIVQAEEWDFLFRLAYRWNIAFVSEPLVLYRMTGHFNPAKRLNRHIGQAHEETIKRAFSRVKGYPGLEALRKKALIKTWWLNALYQYAVRRPDLAIEELDRIATLSPDYLSFAENPGLKTSMAYIAWGLYDTTTPLHTALTFVDYVFDCFPPTVKWRRMHR